MTMPPNMLPPHPNAFAMPPHPMHQQFNHPPPPMRMQPPKLFQPIRAPPPMGMSHQMNMNPETRQVLGEKLYAKIHRLEPKYAGKITGMVEIVCKDLMMNFIFCFFSFLK